MSKQPAQGPVEPILTDPHNVRDLFCEGPVNVNANGPFATLTFTCLRPEAGAIFGERDQIPMRAVVCARLVMSTNNLAALRDLLNRVVQVSPPSPTKN